MTWYHPDARNMELELFTSISSTMEHLGLAATNTTSSGDTSDLRCRQLEKPTKIKLREGGTKLAVGQIRMVKDRFSRVVNWSVILV